MDHGSHDLHTKRISEMRAIDEGFVMFQVHADSTVPVGYMRASGAEHRPPMRATMLSKQGPAFMATTAVSSTIPAISTSTEQQVRVR